MLIRYIALMYHRPGAGTATVTDTLLQSHTINGMALSSIDLLTRELEFEYLASRIMFFQGLLNWLCGIAIHQVLPSGSAAGKKFSELSVEDKSRRRLALSNGAGVATLAMMMLAFYNRHIPTTAKYRNYTEMLGRLVRLAAVRYFAFWKDARVVPLLALVPMGMMLFNTHKALWGEGGATPKGTQ